MSTNEQVKDEVQLMIDRTVAIKERIAKMQLFHEDLVVIERIDTASVITFLYTDPRARDQRMRTSWYARIIAVSERNSSDDVKECKKREISVDDIVSYNPETAYSLNVHEFPEIWCISVENVLVIDRGFDPVQAKRDALAKKQEIEEVYEREQQAGAKLFMEKLAAQEALKKQAEAGGTQANPQPQPGIVIARK